MSALENLLIQARSRLIDRMLNELRDQLHFGDWDLAHKKAHEAQSLGITEMMDSAQRAKLGYIVIACCGNDADSSKDYSAMLEIVGKTLNMPPETTVSVKAFAAYVKAMREVSLKYLTDARKLYTAAGFKESDKPGDWTLGDGMDPNNPPHISVNGEHSERFCWCCDDSRIAGDDEVLPVMRRILAES